MVTLLTLATIAPLAAAPTAATTPELTYQQTDTPTPASTNNSTTEASPVAQQVFGDPGVYITGWSYVDGTFRITFHADAYVPTLTVSAPPDNSGSGAARGRLVKRELTRGDTVVQIEADGGAVWISTDTSTANGQFTELTADTGTPIIGGPFDGADVRNAALGAAVGVALVMLYQAFDAVVGHDERGERIA